MRTYTALPPSLDGILSDDHLFFEGLQRPQAFFLLRDGAEAEPRDVVVLEKYFNDTYNLFLRKLTTFAAADSISSEESLKLQALLQELMKVKNLIHES